LGRNDAFLAVGFHSFPDLVDLCGYTTQPDEVIFGVFQVFQDENIGEKELLSR
jgi:hypothetical protein